MGTILIGYDVESTAVGESIGRLLGPAAPQYLAALEPESAVRGLEIIGRAHAGASVPGTLFVCGRTLLHALPAVEAARATGLLDVQQHTFSHVPFRDVHYSPQPAVDVMLKASPPVALLEELAFTSRLIRKHIGHECVGLRTPFGYYRGLRDRPDLLAVLRETGIRYVTSWGRNEANDNPTPWIRPFRYEEEGYDDVLEIPFQFWLDAIWFDRHGWDDGAGFLKALKGAVDEVAAGDLVYGACFHDWAMLSSNEEQTGWLRGFLEYAKERAHVLTYTEYWRRTAAQAEKEKQC